MKKKPTEVADMQVDCVIKVVRDRWEDGQIWYVIEAHSKTMSGNFQALASYHRKAEALIVAKNIRSSL